MPTNLAIAIALQQPPPSTVDFLWWHWPTDEFAAWGQWAGGVGSIAAVIVALMVIVRDQRRARKQQQELADERERAAHEVRLGQARTVIGALGLVDRPGPGATERYGQTRGLVVVNHGLRPVFEVTLEMLSFTMNGRTYRDWQLTRGFALRSTAGVQRVIEVLGPGETLEVGTIKFTDAEDVKLRWSAGEMTATITFLDVEGHRWRRVGNGRPTEIGEPSLDG